MAQPLLALSVKRQGEIPVDQVTKAYLGVVSRGVGLAVRELVSNLSGRLVQRRTGKLISGIEFQIVAKPREVVGVVGFNKDVAFRAAFLERGTRAHVISAQRRARLGPTGRTRFSGRGGKIRGKARSHALLFEFGGSAIFANRVKVGPIAARLFMLETRREIEQPIRDDLQRSVNEALNA
jgi:hypothetical protein